MQWVLSTGIVPNSLFHLGASVSRGSTSHLAGNFNPEKRGPASGMDSYLIPTRHASTSPLTLILSVVNAMRKCNNHDKCFDDRVRLILDCSIDPYSRFSLSGLVNRAVRAQTQHKVHAVGNEVHPCRGRGIPQAQKATHGQEQRKRHRRHMLDVSSVTVAALYVRYHEQLRIVV